MFFSAHFSISSVIKMAKKSTFWQRKRKEGKKEPAKTSNESCIQ